MTKEFAIDMSHRLEKLASAVLKEIKTKEKKYEMIPIVKVRKTYYSFNGVNKNIVESTRCERSLV